MPTRDLLRMNNHKPHLRRALKNSLIYSLICTDTSDLIHWQSELIEYSWSKCEQPGVLIRLVASQDSTPLPVHRHAQVIRTRFSNTDSVSGDTYPPYNRLYSLVEWISSYQPSGTVLILDPDFIFRKRVPTEVNPGSPSGQRWLDFGMTDSRKAITREVSDLDFAALQPVTWPVLIHTDDLARLMPRWIELTRFYRMRTGGWESDMFAFVVASTELGIDYSLQNFAAWMPWPEEQVKDAPIVHYCQTIRSRDDRELWSKYRYEPWRRVKLREPPALDYCRDVIGLVDEYAQLRHTADRSRHATIFVAIAAYREPELVSTIENCLAKAAQPTNLRFGICLQYDDNGGPDVDRHCLDRFSTDSRFRIVSFDYTESDGGCWARHQVQELYRGETYTLQVDAHTRFVESWDLLLIQMLHDLPSDKPLITGFPPLYTRDANGIITLTDLDNPAAVPTAIAATWSKDGWIHHPHKRITSNTGFPRATRFLSGAFVFTLGQWNEEVRQDPEHLYTGEEFALTVRSYTHGYDLFNPNRIVVWHRCHPVPNPKFISDAANEVVRQKHENALARLRTLLKGDPEGMLGRYGLGQQRTLADYTRFSGLDCGAYSIHPDAANGVPPPLSTSRTAPRSIDEIPSGAATLSPDSPATEVELTIRLRGMDTLELACAEDNPVLATLFRALFRNRTHGADDELIYLEIGDDPPTGLYFKSSQLLMIEASPPLSQAFLSECAASGVPTASARFDDTWKHWIWNNVNRGCTRDSLFKVLIDKGFPYELIARELGYEPTEPLARIANGLQFDRPATEDHFIANAQRLDTPNAEVYMVDDFLDAAECGELIAAIKSDLKPSNTVAGVGAETGRTSSTCYLTDVPLASSVHTRLCKLMGINPSYAEPIQGHIYLPDQEYKAHYDWFDPGTESFQTHASDASGGQRTWTALVYLNAVEEGGGTELVRLDRTIAPQPGRVLIWNNLLPSGRPNPDVLHRAQPVISGEKAVLTIWFRSKGSGEMWSRDPADCLPNHTRSGYMRDHIPQELHAQLQQFYLEQGATALDESVPDYIQGESGTPSELIELPRSLKLETSKALRPILENWCGQKLESTAVYGIRRYRRGATLTVHRDRSTTHVISAILNIEQIVDKDWPLYLEDNYYRPLEIVMRPGDMLLYEGARLMHGRPQALEGDSYANVFVHFKPGDDSSMTDDEIVV
jgi:prolyl 4-hydroxylase